MALTLSDGWGNQMKNEYHEPIERSWLSQESFGLKPGLDWVNCFPPESPIFNWKVVFQRFFQKWAKEKLIYSYQQFTYHLSYEQVLC